MITEEIFRVLATLILFPAGVLLVLSGVRLLENRRGPLGREAHHASSKQGARDVCFCLTTRTPVQAGLVERSEGMVWDKKGGRLLKAERIADDTMEELLESR